MKKRVIRNISALHLTENGNFSFEQKMSPVYFILYGFFSFLFNKKDKSLPHESAIKSITTISSLMRGNIIEITTSHEKYILEANKKSSWKMMVEYLNNSRLRPLITQEH